jgi:zona occludens toxin (predicted ATPase)
MWEKDKLILVVVLLVAIFSIGLWIGHSRGYKKAEADIKQVQTEAAKKAAEQAAKAANPFEAANPLGGVEANPFEKTKKILNPF